MKALTIGGAMIGFKAHARQKVSGFGMSADEEITDELPAVDFGLSIGGMIAQALASARPDLVRGLVLMDTAHKIGTAEMWGERMTAIRRRLLHHAESMGSDADVAELFGDAMTEGQPER